MIWFMGAWWRRLRDRQRRRTDGQRLSECASIVFSGCVSLLFSIPHHWWWLASPVLAMIGFALARGEYYGVRMYRHRQSQTAVSDKM